MYGGGGLGACAPVIAHSEEAGRAEFNVATPTYYATVAYSVRYSQTKLILNYFKRGSTLNLNEF